MFMLRRAVCKARSLSATSLLKKSYAVTSRPSIAFRLQHRQWNAPTLQRRFASESTDTEKIEYAPTESTDQEKLENAAAESASAESAETAQAEGKQSEPAADIVSESSAFPAADGLDPNSSMRNLDKNRTLYIGNLFFAINEEQLAAHFERYGKVVLAKVLRDSASRSRGFGYVEFENQEDADKAMELNLSLFEGRRIAVQYSVPRAPRFDARGNLSKAPQTPTKTLFIGNMSFDMTDKDLNDLFRDLPNVLDVRVAVDRNTGIPRGFCHADFMDVQSAKAARERLQGKIIYGRQLRIDYSFSSRSRPESDPR